MIAYVGGDRHKYSGVGALVKKRSARQSCQHGAYRRYCSLLRLPYPVRVSGSAATAEVWIFKERDQFSAGLV